MLANIISKEKRVSSHPELVFRRKALSRKQKLVVIVTMNIVLFIVLVIAVNNLDYILFDQYSGEPRHKSGRILGLLVVGLPIMLAVSIMIGVSKEKSMHIAKEGLVFDAPNPFSKPIPWSRIKSVDCSLPKSITFNMHESSEYDGFTIKLSDYKISESDVPKLVKAVNDAIFRSNVN
jgi:uncharacterized integral membrane protein